MNKTRIALGLLTIGATLAMVTGATVALFSDTETSTGNTLTAGTIDIAVDKQNPWTNTYSTELTDVKPCEERVFTFTVENVGTNPLKLWKKIKSVVTVDDVQSEPECTDQGGTWTNPNGPCTYGPNGSKDDIDTVIDYDLYLDRNNDGDFDDYYETVISGKAGITVADIKDHYIYLGDLTVGGKVGVKQSYHMRKDTGNWAQGDKMTFDIELYAEQTTGGAMGPATTTLLMENKDASWNVIPNDGMYGILTFKTSGSTFDYDFKGRGLKPTTSYSLIYYADPWPGNNPGALIGTLTTDASGNGSISGGSKDLGMDLPHASDANYPGGAKVWLVLSSNYDAVNHKLIGAWDPTKHLYEYNLIKYDDTDL